MTERLLGWVALVLLAACGPSGEGELRVDVLFPASGLGDRSYSDAVYGGLVRAGLDTDFRLTDESPADSTEAARLFAEWTSGPRQGPELILTMVGVPGRVPACDFGGRQVVSLDSTADVCPGIETISYRAFAPSFLAGVAAVAVSSRRTASVLGGMDTAVVDAYVRGFVAGVASAGGTVLAIEYLSTTEDGFSSPADARLAAERLYADADVVFPIAGASGMGVFEAAKSGTGRYTFGMDVDQSWLGRGVIVGSVVKRLDLSVIQVIGDEAAGTFAAGAQSLGLAEGGTELVVNELFADRVAAAVAGARDEALRAETADLATRSP